MYPIAMLRIKTATLFISSRPTLLRLSVIAQCGWRGRAFTVSTEQSRHGVNMFVSDFGRYRRTHIEKGEALDILHKFDQQGIPVDPFTYVKVLQKVCKIRDITLAKYVHDHIVQSGVEPNIYVLNNLLKVYIDCGSLVHARQIFEKIENKNLITWNILIGGYVRLGRGEEAFKVFHEMQQEGLEPDSITYLNILNACANPIALALGKEIHTQIIDARLESDVRVGTALVNMYARSGSIETAWQVFDRLLTRNIISWNVMIKAFSESGYGDKAFKLFLQMQQEGVKPDAMTYLSILNPAASAGALNWLREVHARALKSGLESDVRVGNSLIKMYAKSGCIEEAQPIFNKMVKSDIKSWNVMIGAYSESGHGDRAFELFLQMQREGLEPNAITYMSILNPCAITGASNWIREVHAHAFKMGIDSDVRVGNALVNMYAKSCCIQDARQVFDRMETRDIISWNAMIGAYAENGDGHKAFELFLRMQQNGLEPNAITYLSILSPRACEGRLDWLKEVHMQALKVGLEMDVRVANALVNMYAKIGSVEDAWQAFNKMVKRNVISWTVMIGAYSENGYGDKAFDLFLQMQQEGLKPNAITYLSILNPCASAGALNWLKVVHSQAWRAKLDYDVRVCNALVNMYAKCGSIEDAWQVFDQMAARDVISWTCMIGGLAQHGCGHEALQLFEKMKREDVRPDEITFVGVLSACSHAGLVDEGRRHFLSMSQDFGIKPAVVHYTCMVDLLGRAGHLEEAENLIKDMSVEADATTWGALLGACRTHVNVEVAERAAEKCLSLEPEDASVYVSLSNIYADTGMWDQVLTVRKMMKDRGVRKEPGCSWIEVDKKVHSFVAGDTSHPQSEEIYSELERLNKEMMNLGYIPDTRFIMHHMAEQQKIGALCFHSERLAIAFGLISTPAEAPIRIFKNLRVCSDCHTATKFISKVVGREIVARDANRFHHFKDGVCSCNDYW